MLSCKNKYLVVSNNNFGDAENICRSSYVSPPLTMNVSSAQHNESLDVTPSPAHKRQRTEQNNVPTPAVWDFRNAVASSSNTRRQLNFRQQNIDRVTYEEEEECGEEAEPEVTSLISFSAAQELETTDESAGEDELPEMLKPSTMLRDLPETTRLPDAGRPFVGMGKKIMRSIPGLTRTLEFHDSKFDFVSNEEKKATTSTKYAMTAIVSLKNM